MKETCIDEFSRVPCHSVYGPWHCVACAWSCPSGQRFRFLRWPQTVSESDKFYCYALKDQFGILVDGTVVPCCLDSDGVINLGNIYNSDIATILNSVRANKIADGFKCGVANENLCKKCGYAQRFV